MTNFLSGLRGKRNLSCLCFYRPVIIGIVFLLFAALSCKKEDPSPTPSDEITLSSKTFGTQPYYSEGYSFETQEFYPRISSGTEIDIYLNELLKVNGEPVGVQFSTNTISESTFGFYLNFEGSDLNSASEYFNNYTEAFAPEYVTLTDTIREFQVYTFRTWKSNYVKFFVKEIRVIKEEDVIEYLEVDIKYFIQRNGSKNLGI